MEFLSIAQGSLTETETLALLCVEFGWFNKKDAEPLFACLEETAKMLTAMRKKYRE